MLLRSIIAVGGPGWSSANERLLCAQSVRIQQVKVIVLGP